MHGGPDSLQLQECSPFAKYFSSECLLTRLTLLAQLKQQMATCPPIMMDTITTFLESSFTDIRQVRMFTHVVSLAIKHTSSEDHFRHLIQQLTEYLDQNNHKLPLIFAFFTEIIDAIESDTLGSSSKRCHFECYFTNHFLNQMLCTANYFLEQYVKKADEYTITADEQTICSILQLIHRSFTYNFTPEAEPETLSLIIPTKFSRYANFSEFERWSKLSEWLEVYQHIYFHSGMHRVKCMVVDILGDMARIHMRYFRTKLNYRTHIENIAIAFGNILDELVLSGEEEVSLALVIGHGINHLTHCAPIAMFSEMNVCLLKSFVGNLAVFIVEQILQLDVINSSLIRYYFYFFNALCVRSTFDASSALAGVLEMHINYIGRNYESYIKSIVKRAFKSRVQRGIECFRDALEREDVSELELYFLPFRCYKIKKISVDSIQQLFYIVCCRAEKCMSYMEIRNSEEWEKHSCAQVLHECIDRVEEWYGYAQKLFQEPVQLDSSSMSVIKEVSQEEIDNEDQYIHLIRILLLYLLDKITHQNSLSPTAAYTKPLYPKTRLLLLSLQFIADNIHINNTTLISYTLSTLLTIIHDDHSSDPYWQSLIAVPIPIHGQITPQLHDLVLITLFLTPIIDIYTCTVYLKCPYPIDHIRSAIEQYVIEYNPQGVGAVGAKVQCLALMVEGSGGGINREIALNMLYKFVYDVSEQGTVDERLREVTVKACDCIVKGNILDNGMVQKVLTMCHQYRQQNGNSTCNTYYMDNFKNPDCIEEMVVESNKFQQHNGQYEQKQVQNIVVECKKQPEEKKILQIYSGYHRDITMQLAQKYLPKEKNETEETEDEQSEFDNFFYSNLETKNA